MDNTVETIGALDPDDPRVYEAKVAGPAALLVAKTYKITDRLDTPRRLEDKDAHDMYRIFVAVETEPLAHGFRRLLTDPVSGPSTTLALEGIGSLVASGPEAVIPLMAGRAEAGIGDPETVALSMSLLAKDLITEVTGAE